MQRLVMADAVAAIIRTPQDRFLMQLRDNTPNIWYPGAWGCFGGALDADEKPLDALRRELREELELDIADATLISRLEFDLRPSGYDRCFRDYYLVEPSADQLTALVLREGEGMAEFPLHELIALPMTPYDAFAVHLYWAKHSGALVKAGQTDGL